MSRESCQAQTERRLVLQLRLLEDAAIGRLDNLDCPNCRHAAVSVWFTRPAADSYRTWFICADCDFHTRVQNTNRPHSFSQERVNGKLEEHDFSILKQALFRRPD